MRGPYGRIPEHAEAAQRERVELEQVHALRRGKLLQPLVEECEGAEPNGMRRRTSAYAFIQTAVACVREHMCARLRERRPTHASVCVRAAAAAHSGRARARARLRDGRRLRERLGGGPASAPTKQRGGCHRSTWSMRDPRGSGRALGPIRPNAVVQRFGDSARTPRRTKPSTAPRLRYDMHRVVRQTARRYGGRGNGGHERTDARFPVLSLLPGAHCLSLSPFV